MFDIGAVPEHARGHVDMYSRFLGWIRVASPGSQHGDLLAWWSSCYSGQFRHPPQAHRGRARRVTVVDVGRADDQASCRRSHVARCHSRFLDVSHPAFQLRTAPGWLVQLVRWSWQGLWNSCQHSSIRCHCSARCFTMIISKGLRSEATVNRVCRRTCGIAPMQRQQRASFSQCSCN